jgi:hypothetical protein
MSDRVLDHGTLRVEIGLAPLSSTCDAPGAGSCAR